MPDYPQAALAAASRAISEEMGNSRAIEPDEMARAALDAAAPLLADAVAEKLLAHMEIHGPRDQGTRKRTWRRHFRAAAQIAQGAFTTRDEMLAMAAEAVASGNYVACPAPEGEQ